MDRTKNYDHDADGQSPDQRIENEGYVWASYAENIAWSASPRHAFDTWMNSPQHRENVLSDETEVGFGVVNGVYVALFATPRARP